MTRERMLGEYQRCIEAFSREDAGLVAELRTMLARLELVSHTSAVNYGGTYLTGGKGGPVVPPGGDGEHPRGDTPLEREQERMDLAESIYSKTVDHYRWRVSRCRDLVELEAIRDEARDTLGKWRRQKTPNEPEFGSPQWKRWVSESKESHAEIARKFNCSRQYILEVRRAYGVAAVSGM